MPSTWLLYAFVALAGWGVAAPVSTYLYAWLTTRAEERAACNGRIVGEVRKVAATLNADADAKVRAAVEAAEAVTPTPTAPAELQRLCQQDKTCRDRGKP